MPARGGLGPTWVSAVILKPHSQRVCGSVHGAASPRRKPNSTPLSMVLNPTTGGGQCLPILSSTGLSAQVETTRGRWTALPGLYLPQSQVEPGLRGHSLLQLWEQVLALGRALAVSGLGAAPGAWHGRANIPGNPGLVSASCLLTAHSEWPGLKRFVSQQPGGESRLSLQQRGEVRAWGKSLRAGSLGMAHPLQEREAAGCWSHLWMP